MQLRNALRRPVPLPGALLDAGAVVLADDELDPPPHAARTTSARIATGTSNRALRGNVKLCMNALTFTDLKGTRASSMHRVTNM
jgi:hypothetical protein